MHKKEYRNKKFVPCLSPINGSLNWQIKQKRRIFMDIDRNSIYKIVGNHHRFISPFSEPYGYYIFTMNPQEEALMNEDLIAFYLNKLQYAVLNADFLIKQAFHISYYEFIKNHHKKDLVIPPTPDDMCQQLIVDSFVLCPEQKEIGSALSNAHFMFGHYIDCRWDYDWNFISSFIC